MKVYYLGAEHIIEGKRLFLVDYMGTILSYKTGLRKYTSEFFEDLTKSEGRIYVHSDCVLESMFPELLERFGLMNYVKKCFGNENLIFSRDKNRTTIKNFSEMISIANVVGEDTLVISDEDELAAVIAGVDLFKVPKYDEGEENFSFFELKQKINKLEYA